MNKSIEEMSSSTISLLSRYRLLNQDGQINCDEVLSLVFGYVLFCHEYDEPWCNNKDPLFGALNMLFDDVESIIRLIRKECSAWF